MASSLHAVDHVLNGISAPSITPNFSAHAGAHNATASVEGALKQSLGGLEQAKDARVALAAVSEQSKEQAGANLTSMDAAKGPSILGQIGQAIGVAAIASVSPGIAAAVAMGGAVMGAKSMMAKSGGDVIDAEYAKSDFKSFDNSMAEVDAFYSATGDAEGQTYTAGFVNQPGIQIGMLEAARDTVAALGAKQVQSDLGTASANEQNLERQLGATRQFAELNGIGQKDPALNQDSLNGTVAKGWSAPKPVGGMDFGM